MVALRLLTTLLEPVSESKARALDPIDQPAFLSYWVQHPSPAEKMTQVLLAARICGREKSPRRSYVQWMERLFGQNILPNLHFEI